MTDYGKWEKFDVDKELVETAARDEAKDYAAALGSILQEDSKILSEAQSEATRLSEALKAKEAVAALRARCAPGAHRRKGGFQQPPPEGGASSSIADPPQAKNSAVGSAMGRLADAMSSLSTALSELSHKAQVVTDLSGSARGNEIGVGRCLEALAHAEQMRLTCFPATSLLLSKAQSSEMSTTAASEAGESFNEESIRASAAILDKVETATTQLTKQIAVSLSVCALLSWDFALAADVARYRLRMEPPSTLCTDRSLAPVWMVRALAFAGMGSIHLALADCQRLQRCSPDYPNIGSLVDHLQEIQLEAIGRGREHGSKRGMCELVDCELAWQLQRLTADLPSLVEDIYCISPSVIRTLLPRVRFGQPIVEDGEIQSEGKQSPQLEMEFAGNWLHADGARDDSAQDPSLGVAVGLQAKGEKPPESAHLAGSLLASDPQQVQVLARLLFQEGQLLFLESLYRSAEIKYSAAVVFATASRTIGDLRTGGETGTPGPVSRLVAASLLNMAACRVHRCHFEREVAPKELPSESELSSLTLEAMSARDLCSAALKICDCSAGRVRASLVFEALHLHAEALALIESPTPDTLPGDVPGWETFVPNYGTSPSFSQAKLGRMADARLPFMPGLPAQGEAPEAGAGLLEALLAERRSAIRFSWSRTGTGDVL